MLLVIQLHVYSLWINKTLMVEKSEGKRRRGWQRMRWLEGITDLMAMNLSRLWEMVKDREVWHAAIHVVAKSQAQVSGWTTTTKINNQKGLETTVLAPFSPPRLPYPTPTLDSSDWLEAFKDPLLLFSRSVMSDSLWHHGLQHTLCFTIFQSLLKLMSIESVIPSNQLIIYHPLLLFPRIRVLSNESALHLRWWKYWSFSLSKIPWAPKLLYFLFPQGAWRKSGLGYQLNNLTPGFFLPHFWMVCMCFILTF